MRTRLLAALCLWTTLAPYASRAQPAEAPPEGGGETEGTEVLEQPTGDRVVMPPGSGGRESSPGSVHTVVKGDTLWDLSQAYLGSPWYWPKVWSYNPEIANPHWIYPGNTVRFFGAGEEGGSRVEVSNAPGQEVPEGDDPFLPDYEDAPVQLMGQIGYRHTGSTVIREGFVTRQDVEEAGVIAGSFAESAMLSFPDTVYVKFRRAMEVRAGDRYVVFRPGGMLKHPITGEQYGYITRYVGVVQVKKIDNVVVTAQILNTTDEVVRGDLIGPFGENLFGQVNPRPNDRSLQGYIVGSLTPALTMYGEHHYVVVDKGSADGVAAGNTFTVIRQSDQGGNFLDPSKNQDTKLPVEEVGSCMTIDVKDRASTCLVTRSIRELVAGDRVEMRTGATSKVSMR